MTPISLEALAARVTDAALVALPPDDSLSPGALVHALIRRGVRDLRLVGVPTSGYASDLLIGAGCVVAIETAAVSLGEAGTGPRFAAAVAAGTIRVLDATCPAIHTALQAAEKGVPYMPLRGVLGSDVLGHRPDWHVVANPFAADDDPILLVPAITPDFALFHATCADEEGNVWVGRRRELATMAHAARHSLVTVERIVPGRLLDNEIMAPGVISGVYVDAIAVAARGAWPAGLLDEYDADRAHVSAYARAARTDAGFAEYLAQYVLGHAAKSAA